MPSVIKSLLERLEAEKRLPQQFENLRPGEFEVKSEWTGAYNCIAFAAGETHRKWWPIPLSQMRVDCYWPADAPRAQEVRSFVIAFKRELGYTPCDNADLEEGIEKVAIYAAGDRPTHMARQRADGRWVSKLGNNVDIAHNTLAGVEGSVYGTVAQILCRNRPN